jgi:predicted unusual protein kinase regulating ubiquinone biosynthesis (AarF/ABC1/UbiB family)
VLADGRLGVLDFGACNRLPNGFPEPFKRLLRNALEGDAIALYNGFKEDGFILADVDVDPQLVLDYLLPLVEPLRTEYFAYTREWLREQSVRVGDPRNPTAKIGFQLNLPPEYVLIHRVTLGTTGIFCQLRAEGNFRDEALSWFPEITPTHLQTSPAEKFPLVRKSNLLYPNGNSLGRCDEWLRIKSRATRKSFLCDYRTFFKEFAAPDSTWFLSRERAF